MAKVLAYYEYDPDRGALVPGVRMERTRSRQRGVP